jgi:RPA family protein
VNEAYSQGDADALQRILDEFGNSPESVQGEGVGAELVRIIRQIHQARKNIAAIEQELENLRASEIAQLRQDAEAARQENRDLLAKLAADVHKRIANVKKKHETLSAEVETRG